MMRKIQIRRAGNRPSLLLGGDRELVLVSLLLSGVMLYSGIVSANVIPIIAAVVFWVAAVWVFRIAAKADPLLRLVYLRSLSYSKYYPARSKPWRINVKSRS